MHTYGCRIVHGRYHVMWLSPRKYNNPTLIEANIRSIPHFFFQMKYLSCILLHGLIVLFEYQWIPRNITLDFEIGRINVIKHEFSESIIGGCYFHSKKAIYKKIDNTF
ncbi:hypothetical protein HZS_3714 [Henneguya salminicola]|nr:hypothetical protein HZS_3714 [Henneguya salminicola]